MNIEELREYCMAKPFVTEDFPFGPEVMTFKVADKMFALTNLFADDFAVNLKCEPEYALELREQHPDIRPGYHMDKRHWNIVDFRGSLPDSFLRKLIDLSYKLVIAGLPKSKKIELFGE